jgi:hypothetical protein
MKRAWWIALIAMVIVAALWTMRRSEHRPGTPQRYPQQPPTGTPRRVALPDADDPGKPAADPDVVMQLDGRVIGPRGQPIAGAVVVLEAASSRTTTTESNGRFSFGQLEEYSYSVFASAGDLIAGPIRFTLPAPPRPLVLRLIEGGVTTATVEDEAGQPIAGAGIHLANGAPTSTVQTDARGTVVLGPLPPGLASIEVNAQGYAPAVQSIVLRSGAHEEVTIVLHRGVSIAGHVLDENHEPIANARISADGATAAVSNARGEFVLDALARGSYVLRVQADPHARMAWGPLKVGETPISGIEIIMKDGAVISGVVLDQRRNRAPFAAIFLAGGTTPLTIADHTGAFELRGWTRGSIQLHAETAIASSDVVSVDLADKAHADVQLVLDNVGAIEGTVVDDRGDSLAGIAVVAVSDEAERLVRFRLPVTNGEAITDDDGRFVLRGLPGVPLRLCVKPPGIARPPLWSRCLIAKLGDRDVEIKLVSGGRLIGRVVVDHSDTPPKDLSVSVGFQLAATPHRDGSFQLNEIPPGTYDLLFYSPDFTVFGKHDVEIKSGTTTDLGTITAMPGRTLVGRVVDSSGTPVGIAQIDFGIIRLAPADDEVPSTGFRLYRTVIAKRDGTFSVALPPEPLTAFASDPDHGTSAAVAIPGGPNTPSPITFMLPDATDDR